MTAPTLIRHAGRLCWRLADGRLLLLVAGGDDDPPKDDPPKEDPKDPSKDDDGAADARREAKALRDRLKAAEAERDKLKASQQTDAERLEARAAAAEEKVGGLTGKVRQLALRAVVSDMARDLGIVDAKLATRLLDAEKVTYDDDNEPEAESVKRALVAVVKDHPVLTRGGDGDLGGSRRPVAGSGIDAINDYLRGGPAPAGR